MKNDLSPELSIIIVTWNTRTMLIDCIRSIRSNPPACPYEIVVVDNGSTDGTAQWLADEMSDVICIVSRDNLGFARANNLGIHRARGEFMLLLNSDTLVHEGALDALLAYMRRDASAGIVGPALMNMDGSLQPSWASFPTIWSEALGRNFRTRMPVAELTTQGAYSVDWIGGAALLVRRSVLSQIGLLDENIFMYAEETDLCRRAKLSGWRTVYLEDAAITHLGGGSASRASYRQLQLLYDSKLYYARKHQGRMAALVLRILFIVSTGLSVLWRNVSTLGARSDESSRAAVRARWSLLRHLAHWGVA